MTSSTINNIFVEIFENSNETLPQINANYLQIEDEYYSACRPKSNLTDNLRLISKLKKSGVDYLELRSIDLNPFIMQ